MKVFLLSGGLLDADRNVIHPGDTSGRRVLLPCFQVVIQQDGRSILIDTGMPPAAVGNSDGLKREHDIDPLWIRPIVRSNEALEAQLDAIGLALGDLDMVVNTHLHFDHAGQNALFAGKTIAVQRSELESARQDEYLTVWDAPGLLFRPVEGDWSPLPGVEMVHTPGHTPGHQSMMVRLPDRPWLFTFDAVYTEEHWRGRKLGAVQDIPAARASTKRLRDIARQEDARLIFGHDLGQWESLGGDSHAPRLVAEA